MSGCLDRAAWLGAEFRAGASHRRRGLFPPTAHGERPVADLCREFTHQPGTGAPKILRGFCQWGRRDDATAPTAAFAGCRFQHLRTRWHHSAQSRGRLHTIRLAEDGGPDSNGRRACYHGIAGSVPLSLANQATPASIADLERHHDTGPQLAETKRSHQPSTELIDVLSEDLPIMRSGP